MARRIATVGGYALRPGVSRNGRLYTREAIAKMVTRAQERIASTGGLDIVRPVDPMSQRTHHAAEDDSTRIVGRLTAISLSEDGSARFRADIADTSHGRDIAALIAPHDPHDPASVPPFLSGVSIRGAWVGAVKRIQHNGHTVETGDDLELDGLDYTGRPGVPGAGIDEYTATGTGRSRESVTDRSVITESVQEAVVSAPVQEKGAPALKSGKPAAAPTPGAGNYADPGYQDDRAKRYPLDTVAHARAAWSYINQAKNAANYTGPQLKRIKGRVKSALQKFGVKVADEGWLVDPVTAVTETDVVSEDYGDMSGAGSYCVRLTNGPTTVTVTSYQIDPADLDLIGRAAMDGACQALAALDPDMDGDIDVPGADAEDTDDDMETGADTGGPVAGETVIRTGAATVSGDNPGSSTVDENGDPTNPGGPDAGAGDSTTVNSPDDSSPTGEPDEIEEEPDVSEPTAPEPVEPSTPTAPTTPAEPAAEPQAGVTMTNDQFAQLLAAMRAPATAGAPAESAPAAPVTDAAPTTAPAAPAAGAAATETDEQRIARLVQEGIRAALPQAVIEHAQTTGGQNDRKGLVPRPVTETAPVTDDVDLGEHGLPSDWPQKPLSKYTDAERRQYVQPALQDYVLSGRGRLQ